MAVAFDFLPSADGWPGPADDELRIGPTVARLSGPRGPAEFHAANQQSS
jgi:hypothetical protein